MNCFFVLGSLCAQSGQCRREGNRAGGVATGTWCPPSGLLSGCAQFPSQDAVGHHTRGDCCNCWNKHNSILVTDLSSIYLFIWMCGTGHGEETGPQTADSVQCGSSRMYRHRWCPALQRAGKWKPWGTTHVHTLMHILLYSSGLLFALKFHMSHFVICMV